MFKGDRFLASASMAILLVGCSALNPKSDMAYSVDPDDPSSPRDGGFAFALRATTVVIAPPASSGPTGTNDKASAPTPGTSNPNTNLIAAAPEPGLSSHSAGSHRSAGTAPKAGKQGTDKADAGGTSPPSDKPNTNGSGGAPATQPATAKTTVVRDVCKDAKGWRDCLSGVSVSTFPVSSDAPVYVVKPQPPTGAKTVLSPKVSDADPLFLTSVSFNTTSTLPTAINSAGGDAVIGLAFGPWGAAAGAVVGLVSGLYTPTANAPEPGVPVTPFSWTSLLCPNDPAKQFSFDQTFKQALLLPVTVDYPDAGSASGSRCWSSLPAANPPGSLTPALQAGTPTGWFYRFMPAALPPHTTRVPPVIVDGVAPPSSIEPTSSYFDKPPKSWTDTRSSLPASACRSVEFQLTYLEDIKTATGQAGFSIYR